MCESDRTIGMQNISLNELAETIESKDNSVVDRGLTIPEVRS
jgi:hypothetical protein